MRKGETHTAPISGILASDLAVGSVVKLMENGVATEYLVVNQGIPSGSSLYDASCDGLWLLRKDIKEKRQWHSSDVNDYANSTIHAWLNGDFYNQLGAVEQSVIKQVKIPYRAGSGTSMVITSGENGLSTKAFLLSYAELGFTYKLNGGSVISNIPNDEGAKLNYFDSINDAIEKRVANLNGSASYWFSRTPLCHSSFGVTRVCDVNTTGGNGATICSGSMGIRPALVIPSNALFDTNTLVLKGVA